MLQDLSRRDFLISAAAGAASLTVAGLPTPATAASPLPGLRDQFHPEETLRRAHRHRVLQSPVLIAVAFRAHEIRRDRRRGRPRARERSVDFPQQRIHARAPIEPEADREIHRDAAAALEPQGRMIRQPFPSRVAQQRIRIGHKFREI